MNSNNKRLVKYIQSSAFVNLLNKISNFFHNKICTCRFAQAFTSYNSLNTKIKEGFFAGLVRRIKPRDKSIIGFKKTISSKIENCYFYNLYRNIISKVLGTKLRMYGIASFVLGLFALGIGVANRFLITPSIDDTTLLWQGVGYIIFSIPLLASKDELCNAIINGRIGNLLIKFMGYKPEDVLRPPVEENVAIPVFIGVVLGILSTFIQPIYILLLLLCIIYLTISFNKPELCIIIAVATLPFLPTMVICAEIILTFIAFVLKVVRGKRSIKFELLDIFVFIFTLFMLLGGLFSVVPSSSIPPACVFVCFLISYFLIVNLIKTKELLNKLLHTTIFSLFICSAYGIYQNFFGTPDTTWTDEDMFSDIETRVVSTFENPNVFGEYLIMLIPVAIALVFASKNFNSKIRNLVPLCTSILALVYTWSRGAWLGCIISLIIFFVILNRYALGAYVVGIFSLPIVIPMLPASILERFSSIGNMADSSTSYRVFIWEASAKMLKDYLVSGIGIGTDVFQTVYSEYALAGIEAAPHSHNLYLQVFIELGILGFAIFIFTIFLFFSKVFTFLKESDNKELKILIGAISCGLLAILAQGLTDYVWYNYRVFAFFWMLLATASVGVSIYRAETFNENIE